MSSQSGDVWRLWSCLELWNVWSLLLITNNCQASHKIVVLPVIVLGEIGSAAKGKVIAGRGARPAVSAPHGGACVWLGQLPASRTSL